MPNTLTGEKIALTYQKLIQVVGWDGVSICQLYTGDGVALPISLDATSLYINGVSVGATNLGYTSSATNGIITSNTGADATIPLATGTIAGLLAPSQFTKLSNLSGTNTGDQDLSGYATSMMLGDAVADINGQIENLAPLASPVFTGSISLEWVADPGISSSFTVDDEGWKFGLQDVYANNFTAGISGGFIGNGSGLANIPQSGVTNLTTDLAAKQPLDSDLTAIAALTTTSFGRSFLTLADAAAGRTSLALGTLATLSAAPAGTLTGATLASGVLASSLTSVGVLTGGSTGVGFTVALDSATVTGTLADGRLSSNVALKNAANVFTTNGAVSAPSQTFNGTWYSGGSGTTTKPYVLIEPSGTTSTGWPTTGTALGINAATGYAGDLANFQVAAADRFRVTADGSVLAAYGSQTNPGFAFIGNTNTGFQGSSGPIGIHMVVGGSRAWLARSDNAHIALGSQWMIGWANNDNTANTVDTIIGRSANSGVYLAGPVGTGTKDPLLTLTGAAHTALTASTEYTDVNFNLARTIQFATGALATQRSVRLQAPTLTAVAASVITDAVTVDIDSAPIASTNVTITNAVALRVGAAAAHTALRVNGNASPSVDILQVYRGATKQLWVNSSGYLTGLLKLPGSSTCDNPTSGIPIMAHAAHFGSSNQGVYLLGNNPGVARGQNNGGLQLGGSNGTSGDNITNIYARATALITWGGDVAVSRNAARVLEVNTSSAGTYGDILTRGLRSNAVTFANAITSPVRGTIQSFTDSTTAVWGATITGGGANAVLGHFNGTNWTVMAA